MPTLLADLNQNEAMLVGLLGACGAIVFAIWIVGYYAADISKKRAREASRREIAAYVAEGTVTADDAVAILNAGADNELAAALAAQGWSPEKIARSPMFAPAAPEPKKA